MSDRTLMWASDLTLVKGEVQPIGGVPTTIAANGTSSTFNISAITVAMASAFVGTPTGTTPTLNIYLDVEDAIGNWLQVLALVQLTASAYTYAAVGPGSPTTYVLTNQARFRWVISSGSTWPNAKLALAGH